MEVVEPQAVRKDEPKLLDTGATSQIDVMDHNAQSAAANSSLKDLTLNSQPEAPAAPAEPATHHSSGTNGVNGIKQAAADAETIAPLPASAVPSLPALLAEDEDTVMTIETSEPPAEPEPHVPLETSADPAVQQPTSDLRTVAEPATVEQANEIREEKQQSDLASDRELADGMAGSSDAPIERRTTPATQKEALPAPSDGDAMEATVAATDDAAATRASVEDGAVTHRPAAQPIEALPEAPSVPAPAPSIGSPEDAVAGLDSKMEPSPGPKPHDQDQVMTDAPPSPGKVARSRDEEGDEEPATKRLKAEDDGSQVPQFKIPDAPAAPAGQSVATSTDPTLAAGVAPSSAAPASGASAMPAPLHVPRTKNPEHERPMTDAQKKHLAKNVANLLRSKYAVAFGKPVDPVALNIPSYFEHVKKPMDLKTMEARVKNNEYACVGAYITDFDQIVTNSEIFNGKTHGITAQAYELRKTFDKSIAHIPSSEFVEPAVPDKKAKRPSIEKPPPQRRESRSSVGTAKSPTTASPSQTFALGPQGIPLIRRDSTVNDGRPRREIHPPAPKDLPYSTQKPKKKKFQWELKFCQELLNEIRKPKYHASAWPFLAPVDPVAMNIPTYHKIIKKPMDLQTMDGKLKSGQYENAKEFEADMRLIFSNCYKFNPAVDHVHKAGKSLEAVFEDKWENKKQWIADHAPVASLQSPESSPEPDDDDDEDEEDEEEEEEEEEDPQQKQIEILQKQIQAMSKQVEMIQTKNKTPPLPSKSKSKNKSGGASGAKAKKESKKKSSKADKKDNASSSKTKKTKIPYVTYEQKQDISNRINTLPESRMSTALTIIRDNMPNLKGVQEDEIELDIDELSNDVLYKLLTFVRKYAPLPKDAEDARRQSHATAASASANSNHHHSTAAAASGRPKKNKPMGKVEQEARIKELKDKLNGVSGGGGGAGSDDENMRTPGGGSGGRHSKDPAMEESSGDDDSEESEED